MAKLNDWNIKASRGTVFSSEDGKSALVWAGKATEVAYAKTLTDKRLTIQIDEYVIIIDDETREISIQIG